MAEAAEVQLIVEVVSAQLRLMALAEAAVILPAAAEVVTQAVAVAVTQVAVIRAVAEVAVIREEVSPVEEHLAEEAVPDAKKILSLAMPSVLANITIPLVGLVDLAIAGHIADASAIGGIAIGTMLFDLLYWNFGFLRVGTSGMTAQAYGRGDGEECAGQLRHSLVVALMGAAGIVLIQWLFVTAALALVPCSPEAAEQARTYFFARVWAAPATLMLFSLKGWFIGMQDTVSPMVVDLVINAVNMVASYLLAVTANMGVAGVAYGTVVAQCVGWITAIAILATKYNNFFVWMWQKSLRKITHATGTNANLFFRSLCFMVIYVGYTALASRYGDKDLAVSSLVMKLFMLVSYFIDGFAYAGEALIGRLIGEMQRNADTSPSHCRRLAWTLHGWCLLIAVFFALMFAFGGEQMMQWLWPDAVTAAVGWNYRPWLIAMPLLAAPAFMWDGIFVGATAAREIRDAMIWAAVFFIGVYVLLMNRMGIEAVLYAYFAHLVARDVYLTLIWKRTYDRQIAKQTLESTQK